MEVAKVNKRLIIRDGNGAAVYVMPSFLLPVRDRSALAALAARLQAGHGIAAIVEFETEHNRRVRQRQKSRPAPKDRAAE